MISQDQLEQLVIQWFHETGWNYVHGAVIAPEGVAAEREDIAMGSGDLIVPFFTLAGGEETTVRLLLLTGTSRWRATT